MQTSHAFAAAMMLTLILMLLFTVIQHEQTHIAICNNFEYNSSGIHFSWEKASITCTTQTNFSDAYNLAQSQTEIIGYIAVVIITTIILVTTILGLLLIHILE